MATRVCFLLLLAFARPAFAADSAQDQLESLALAIQKGDVKGALALFDTSAPGFAEIRKNLEALSALPDTTCSIAIVHTSQSGDTVSFETQWTLKTSTKDNGPLLDRRDNVSVSLRRAGESWKITGFSLPSVLVPPDPSVFERIAKLAADLNDKNQDGATAAFDSHMKQFGEIDNDVDALISQNDLLCAIDIVSDVQTGDTHTLDLDWYLQIKSRADAGPAA